MIRKIIKINEELCNGCGLCADACHERAIEIVDGKAKLIRDDYCDGLGNCLPACPMNAISFEEREALPFDQDAVDRAKLEEVKKLLRGGCAGCQVKQLQKTGDAAEASCSTGCALNAPIVASRLMQWPVQIQLVPVNAPYFDGADLLVAADCTAYAYGNFHNDFIKGRITIIGCPKLDEVDYSNKLTQIFTTNNIKSITLTRMHVPCCGGMERAVRHALAASGKDIPLNVVTIDNEGNILQ